MKITLYHKLFLTLTRWIAVDHHLCHATLGFYDSPFQNALILSYDGGGNDGTFNIYSGTRDNHQIELIKKVDYMLHLTHSSNTCNCIYYCMIQVIKK